MLRYLRYVESFWRVIDVKKDTLATYVCFNNFACRKDFERIFEFFATSAPSCKIEIEISCDQL